MKELFRQILGMKDVKGIMLLSFEGEIIFEEFSSPLSGKPESKGWWRLFIHSLNRTIEADLVFEKSRIYVRRTETGYLLILMGVLASSAMIRLNCDTLLSSLEQKNNAKGLRRFFKKKR